MTNDIKKISIIVPVYNTPINDLKRCINSLINQTNKNFDLIVVDDGSDSYVREYFNSIAFKNLKYIYKCNSGVSDTRNIGIYYTYTDYISFCDSDDRYDINFIDNAYGYLNKYSYPDLIIGNVEYIPTWESEIKQNEKKLYNNNDCYIDLRESFFGFKNRKLKYNINVGPYAKVIKSNIVKKVLFNKRIRFGEDQVFLLSLFDCVNNILIVDDILYYYYQNEYSSTRDTMKQIDFEKYEVFYDEIYKLILKQPKILEHKLYEFELRLLNGYINRTCANNNNISISTSIIRLKKALNHTMMRAMLSNIKVFNKDISLLNSINVILLKLRLYFLYIFEKKMIYKLKLNKDKI